MLGRILHREYMRGNLIAVNTQKTAGGEFLRRYAEAVRLERLRSNLTQREFAALVGVSLTAVQQWEWGQRTPEAVIRRRLSAMYPALRDLHAEQENDEGGADG